MRSDMQKLICERPRRGSRNLSLKTRLRLNPTLDYDSDNIDWGPSRFPCSRRRQYGYEAKTLNENLNPLSRFLETCVGRLWNSVYSEIRSGIDMRKAIGLHVMQHLEYMVELVVVMKDGVPLDIREREINGLYVNPDSGILCRSSSQPSWRRVRKLKAPADSISWFLDTYFKREEICRTSCCRQNSFRSLAHWGISPVVNADGFRYCVHGLKAEIRHIWYVIEYRYHSPNEVYRMERPSTYELNDAGVRILVYGTPYPIYYRDRPKLLAEPFIHTKKVANKKELKIISAMGGSA